MDKGKYISILEINPIRIELLSGLPVHINRDNHDLGRFKSDYNKRIFRVGKKEELLDIETYLPLVEAALKNVYRRKPQIFKIIVTGSWGSSNKEILNKYILDVIGQLKLDKIYIGIDFLTYEQESYYSYMSLIYTSDYNPERDSMSIPVHYDPTGLHFHLDTDKTVISSVKEYKFYDIKTLPTGINSLVDFFMNLTDERLIENFNKKDLKDSFELLKLTFIDQLSLLDFSNIEYDFVVFSGITDVYQGIETPAQELFLSKEYGREELFESNVLDPLENQLLSLYKKYFINGNGKFPHGITIDFKKYVFCIFLSALDEFFEFNKHTYNNGNTRIGYYHHLLSIIKNP